MSERSGERAGRFRVCLLVGAVGLLMASLFSSSVALGDAREECSDAYQRTQVLRDADEIDAGLKESEICARDVCAQWMRDDCAKWKTDLEARQSSIVVEVFDSSGAPAIDGPISLDGAPWLDHADGAAHVVSKGTHTLEVVAKGALPQKQSITIREGEKNRKITFSLVAKPPSPEEPRPNPVHRFGPWIVGGIGVAALVASAVTGGLVVHAHAVMTEECHDPTATAPGYCSQAGRDAELQGQRLGPATTGLLVGGSALVAAGVIWLVAAPRRPKPSPTTFFVAPALSSHQNGVLFGGAW